MAIHRDGCLQCLASSVSVMRRPTGRGAAALTCCAPPPPAGVGAAQDTGGVVRARGNGGALRTLALSGPPGLTPAPVLVRVAALGTGGLPCPLRAAGRRRGGSGGSHSCGSL